MWQLALVFLFCSSALAAKCGTYTSCTDCFSNTDCNWCASSGHCVSVGSLTCIFGTVIKHAGDCPIPVPVDYAYDESFAKTVMLPLCSAAYSNMPQKCLDKALHGGTLVRQITTVCDGAAGDTCSGFSAVSAYYKAIMIAFRGTITPAQLILEGTETVFHDKSGVLSGGLASKYFFEAFDAVWTHGMMEDVMNLRKLYPDYEVWVTGHSLGGSMASIAASTIISSQIAPAEQVKLITFGQPRTGDRSFAEAHDKTLLYSYRVTHKRDMVPHVPPQDFEGYRHHRYEVWYNNDMKPGASYTLCLTPEDDHCSDSNLISESIVDHLHYFDKEISSDHFCDTYN